jgi:hypothetical protein
VAAATLNDCLGRTATGFFVAIATLDDGFGRRRHVGRLSDLGTIVIATSGEHQKYAKKCAKTQPHSKRHKHSIDEDKIEKYIE